VHEQGVGGRVSDYRSRVQAAINGFYAQRGTPAWQKFEEARDQAARPPRKRSQWTSEAAEQRAVLAWLKTVAKLHRDDYSANGDGVHLRSARSAAIAKANGLLRKGRADIEIRAPAPHYPLARGVALEMKSRNPKAQPTPEQRAYLERQRVNGWLTFVAHGSDEAIEWLESLGYGR
jgi:hypothetical protein